jgi:hypothetical protein
MTRVGLTKKLQLGEPIVLPGHSRELRRVPVWAMPDGPAEARGPERKLRKLLGVLVAFRKEGKKK